MRRLVLVFSFGLLTTGGCSAPTAPTPPTPPALVIACPSGVATLTLAVPVAIHYSSPVVTGGTAPVTTVCTGASGSPFPAGVTEVTCRATDSLQGTSECRFAVSVTVPRQLRATKFLAIGDSITEGQVSLPARFPRALESENSYPTVLRTLLRSHYELQSDDIEVVNAGVGGQRATDDEDRIYQEINSRRPEILLLLHGTNDVNAGLSPDTVAASLRADVGRAFSLGVKTVFLSTLLPQIEGRSHSVHPELVEPINEGIRHVATDEGVILVDAFSAFLPQRELLIGVDGLHPSREGYRVLAELFFASIQQELDVDSGPAATLFSEVSLLRPRLSNVAGAASRAQPPSKVNRRR